MFLILTIFLFATGCSGEEIKQQENSIYGTWKLVEKRFGNVGDTSTNWMEVPNGYIITLSETNEYSSTQSPICPSNNSNSGNFILEDTGSEQYLKIILSCSESNSSVFEIEYLYYYDNSFLILSPTFSCDEGCSLKFKKQ